MRWLWRDILAMIWRPVAPMAMSTSVMSRNPERSFAWTEMGMLANHRTMRPSGVRVRRRCAILSCQAATAHVPPNLSAKAGPRQGSAWPPFFRRAKLAFLRRRAMAEQSGLIKGLEGVVAAETGLWDLDGGNG